MVHKSPEHIPQCVHPFHDTLFLSLGYISELEAFTSLLYLGDRVVVAEEGMDGAGGGTLA